MTTLPFTDADPGDGLVPEWHVWPVDGRLVALRLLVVVDADPELRRLEIERAARAWRREAAEGKSLTA